MIITKHFRFEKKFIVTDQFPTYDDAIQTFKTDFASYNFQTILELGKQYSKYCYNWYSDYLKGSNSQ